MTTVESESRRNIRLDRVSRVVLVMLVIVASGALSSFAQISERVHMFYYPWYGTPAVDGRWIHWPQGGHQPPFDIGANFYPRLGAYSSNDPLVFDQHMSWIAQTGASVLVTSWWGRGTFEDRAVPSLLDIADAYGLKVAFHVEPYGGRTAASVRSDIEYLYTQYGRHPAFFRVVRPTQFGPSREARGVFYIFSSLSILDEEWRAMLDTMRNTTFDAFVVGQTSDASRIVRAHFDGLYTYDVLLVDGRFFRDVNRAIAGQDAVFAPSVGPGYIDQRAVPGSTRNRPRQDGFVYDQMWTRAIESESEWISISSFNEWHEGSQIEPAMPFSFDGFTYLNYGGAYGLFGEQAELAYLNRTYDWIAQFEGLAPSLKGTSGR
ncbi:MAG: alpha-mannosidase [Acidobacteria bacterium]|nr:alpha-mannosidase [Acidobacteriota bacterium]